MAIFPNLFTDPTVQVPWKKGSWNHMAIRIDTGRSYLFFDAIGKAGVDIHDEDDFKKRYKIVAYSDIEIASPLKDFMKWANQYRDRQYDKLQILGLLIKNTLNFVSFNRIGHNERKIICSEIIILMLRQYKGLKVVDTDNYDLLDAKELVTKESLNGHIS